jgi:hypothetical protein
MILSYTDRPNSRLPSKGKRKAEKVEKDVREKRLGDGPRAKGRGWLL